MKKRKLNKREIAFLERMFNAEVQAGIGERFTRIYQPRPSQLLDKMIAENMIEPASMTTSGPGLRATVSGYVLTHLGRMMYCVNCTEVKP